MFFLSIVPYALFGYHGPQLNSELGQAQGSLIDLESTLAHITLNQPYYNFEPDAGQEFPVSASTIQEIEMRMSLQREVILQSIGTASTEEVQNIITRSDQVSAHKTAVDIRITDLFRLSYSLESGQSLNYLVSGVDNADLNSVQEELRRVQAYKNLLNLESVFWNQVSEQYIKEQQEKLVAEQGTNTNTSTYYYSNNSLVGFERIIRASDLLQSMQAANETDEENKAQQDIFYAQYLFLKDLSKETNKPWYGDIVKSAMDRKEGLNLKLTETNNILKGLDGKIKAALSRKDSSIDQLKIEFDTHNSLKITLENEIAFMQQVVEGLG